MATKNTTKKTTKKTTKATSKKPLTEKQKLNQKIEKKRARFDKRKLRKEQRTKKRAEKLQYKPKKWHKSFRRSYKEDYKRELKALGLMAHAVDTLKLLVRNWKIFLPFVILIVVMNFLFVGLLSQDTYESFQNAIEETNEGLETGHIGNVGKAALTLIGTVSTGGLNSSMNDIQKVFVFIFAMIIWLVTIYLVRHIIAGNKPKLRDGLYNATTPLISSICVLAVMFLEAIPIMIVAVTYSAAVSTDFLATPFYAIVYLVAAALFCLLSLYLLSSSFLALIAITAPGLYPIAAINTATDLIAGRRIRLFIRLFFGVIMIAIVWILIMLPCILLDNWFKSWVDWMAEIPFIPILLAIMTTVSFIYFAAYSYLYYRQLLDYNSED
ncbi:MAG: hypothetical protein Q4E47_00775 [Candidatus Saccharibacteria bacterium]|nr:hypothetical protein [Candidatus Saccharibacteria bacterium]